MLVVPRRALKQLQQEEDPVMREALRVQMMEFGRTPRQLFTRPHPKRKVRPAWRDSQHAA